MNDRKFEAFWSYTRFDDENDELWLTGLRNALVAEVRALSGKQIQIFQDKDGIAWGERWKQKLASSLDEAIFLIPIITPSYFKSDACRQELKQFVDREAESGFKEFILPIYYIETPQLKNEFDKATDFLAQKIAEHNYIDIKNLRHRVIVSYEAKQKIKEMSAALVNRLNALARRQLLSPDMRANFAKPSEGARVPREAHVSGSLEKIAAGTDVWLVVEAAGGYHPQAQLVTDTANFEKSVFIGRNDSDHGQRVSVHVVAVTEDVSSAFNRYRQDSATFRKWTGVPKPPDSRILATVSVIRDDAARN